MDSVVYGCTDGSEVLNIGPSELRTFRIVDLNPRVRVTVGFRVSSPLA